mmetsp:Transcript_302/g.986  ORF Transcript_302/g.986 Transcript_302/m.986 type:complete len:792 (+) Transcript_302:241-2616(+)|eukprot:CAMPEP_0198731056 /NCGR_PEP_ID=MMETSP1475-20131203/27875_1 /TAXON_ID= ORGANISM="Unidentified sp., Strain CCMP1999" /NCGR_SAMPLE_ID=MMETSP1475 /ASSEMBLY_ACC=CAM_ASM_001111 /LENGTH=791 /DNA_ID=CAMNT_0044493961 /DNA_START=201 /DNA_END=2576 /DNA_ORIENTATION=-
MAAAEAQQKVDPDFVSDRDEERSELSKSNKSIKFADELEAPPSYKSSKSGRSLQFDEYSAPSRQDSTFSAANSTAESNFSGTLFSQASINSTGSGSVRSVSQYTNTDGVSVDLAGRGLAGLNVGGTEVVSQSSAAKVKPERPSGLLSVHSSKYETMQGRPAQERKPVTGFKSKKPSTPTTSSGRTNSAVTSRTSSRTSFGSSQSGRLSGSFSSKNTATSGRRSASGRRFWDDDDSARDSFSSARASDHLGTRSSGMSFSKRASSIVRRQSSFKDGKEMKSEFFGENATVHLLGKNVKVEQIDPDDIQLDVYVNDLEFNDVYDEKIDSDEVNNAMFYKFELVNEQRRLMMVKWLVATHSEKELKALSVELGELLESTPKITSTQLVNEEEQNKDVSSLLEETDRAVREKKHKELMDIYEQRLKSVVEALVIMMHRKAEDDMDTTAIRDEKGKELLAVNRDNMHLRFYDTYETTIVIGQGHFSQVLLCNVKNKPMDLFAVKIVHKLELSAQRSEYLKKELKLAQTLLHPCIIKTYDVYDHWDYAFLVMEYMAGGTLLDLLKRDKYFDEDEAKAIMFDILRGVAHMHKNKIIHRDLKFDNILCSESAPPFRVKIADFGLADFVRNKKQNTRVARTDNKEAYLIVKENEDKEKRARGEHVEETADTGQQNDDMIDPNEDPDAEHILTSAVGTAAYAAPELLKGEPYTYSVDVWACGVILYGMLSGSKPFSGKKAETVLQNIERTGLDFPKKEWGEVSEQARSLCRAMLEVNPQYRVTAEEAMRHTWFNTLTVSFT